VEVVLVVAESASFYGAVLVDEPTAKRVDAYLVSWGDDLFHDQEEALEGEVVVDAQANLFLVVRRGLDDDGLKMQRVTTFPSFNRGGLIVVINGITVA
jgi:hypothetical protein